MTSALTLYGDNPRAVADAAAQFLRAVSGEEPAVVEETGDGAGERVSLGDGLAITAIVLSIAGSLNSVLDLKERLTEPKLVDQVVSFQDALDKAGAEAQLDLGDGRTLDLRRETPDKIVDALSR